MHSSVSIPKSMMNRPKRTDDARRSIANFLILTFGQLHQKFCDLVLDLHLTEDGGAVVGDCYVSICGYEDLVEALEMVIEQ